MCGIAGFYGFKDDNLIKKFSEQLSHRGPDGEGYFINDKASLMNRRLAIIDVKGGDQPIYNEDRSIVVIYNGEVYNYLDLRKELEGKGHKFSTKSDTEVIVHGYEEWKERCFDKLNGMFALALYDIKKEKLVLARDHFGIKPLYYAIINSKVKGQKSKAQVKNQNSSEIKLIFASEIKPILESGLIEKKPNDRIIYRYLKFRVHDDQKETFFKGIYKLMPGEMMTIQNSEFRIQNYSTLKEELLNIKGTEKFGDLEIETFKKKLINAIKLRLISEVPVGSCLSGGLDSSTVVSVVNRLLKEKVKEARSVGTMQKTFSAVFPGGSNDEEKYIDDLRSKILDLKSYKVKPKPEKFFEEIEDFVKTQEEPTISSGPYAQYKVMKEAAKYVTVLLDGQGADEMMAGYLPYYFVYFRQLAKEREYFRLMKELFLSGDIIVKTSIKHLIKVFGLKKNIDIKKLLNKKFMERFNEEKLFITADNLKRRLIEDIFRNSLPSLLRYEDRNSMKYSVEGRVPFLDLNLLKYLFSLPDKAIIDQGWNKNILRKSVKDLLPEMIVNRRSKIGFTTPEYQWFMRMKNKIYQIFLSESFAKRKYFNQGEVLKAFQSFIEGKVDDTMVFWRCLNLELWMRAFFDSNNKGYKDYKNYKEFSPNEGKKLEIEVDGKRYLRYPVRTELFEKSDNYQKKITDHIFQCFKTLEWKKLSNKPFFLVVSEKIIAIAQGRSYFLWEIRPSFWAKLLSKFVTKTPYGIGLGSPWTMQLAIQEVGLPKIIYATIVHQIGRVFGIRGIFYRITGPTVRSIDGPTEYSLYPSNVSAKLGPKEPQMVAERIKSEMLNPKYQTNSKFKILNSKFLGVIIIDANDLGQNVLGNSTNLDNKTIEKIFKDNPMGQADEQTPLVMVFSSK